MWVVIEDRPSAEDGWLTCGLPMDDKTVMDLMVWEWKQWNSEWGGEWEYRVRRVDEDTAEKAG